LQLWKLFKPEVRGVGVQGSTLPEQLLKYQTVALIEVGDAPFEAEQLIPTVGAILRDFSCRMVPPTVCLILRPAGTRQRGHFQLGVGRLLAHLPLLG
jgi:hypothetical protein